MFTFVLYLQTLLQTLQKIGFVIYTPPFIMKLNIIATTINGKKNAAGLVPLYIMVYDGAKLLSKKSLGRQIKPEQWNTETRRVNKKHSENMLLNSIIDKKIYDLNIKCMQDEAQNGVVNFAAMQQKEKANNTCFYKFVEQQTEQKLLAKNTKATYISSIAITQNFRKTLKISEINYEFLQAYENHLREVLEYKQNSIWAMFKFLNTFLNDALKMKLIKENPILTYPRIKYIQKKCTFLNGIEIKLIEDLAALSKKDNERVVCNYFIFMSLTGLRFSDAKKYRSDLHIVNNERIVLTTTKTGLDTNIFITDKIKESLIFLDANPLTFTLSYFNVLLNSICEDLKIDKKITSHVGRHSFGRSLAANGVLPILAQTLLSHSSSKSTSIYYHVSNEELDAAMKKLNG